MKHFPLYSLFPVVLLAIIFKSKFSFYTALKNASMIPTIHILHNSAIFIFVNHFLLNFLHKNILNENTYNIDMYNEIQLEFLGDVLLTMSSFPYIAKIRNIIHFSFLYLMKSLSTMYALKAERTVFKMIPSGIGMLFLTLFFIWFYLDDYSIKYMNVYGLLILEYLLIGISLFTNILTVYIKSKEYDKEEIEIKNNEEKNEHDSQTVLKNNSFFSYFKLISSTPILLALISVSFYVLRICAVSIFAFSLSKFRFPMNFIKIIIIDANNLKKTFVSLINYVNVCLELERQEDFIVENQTENMTCAICTDEIIRGKKLGCKHVFHIQCLKSWCERESTCPICRQGLSFNKEIITENEVITAVPI